MKFSNLFLLFLPFVISAAIIFGHYSFLSSLNPQAHQPAPVSKSSVEPITSEGLAPRSQSNPLPKEIKGVAHEIPTSKKQLNNLLELMRTEKGNTLLFIVGMTMDPEKGLVIPKAVESSEEMLMRWAKKSISEAHLLGLHTYLAFLFIDKPLVEDINGFFNQLSLYIEKWGSMVQEYNVSFYDPGITIGHESFNTADTEDFQKLIQNVERETRKYYTGRIGIGVCCQISNISPRGYNHILFISTDPDGSKDFQKTTIEKAVNNSVEKVFLLNLTTQKISSLK